MSTNNPLNVPTGVNGAVLMGAGVGSSPVFSTATYPSTAGTSGNYLISDGTNFVSTTPTATPFYFSIQTNSTAAALADATTCFISTGAQPTFYAAVTGSQRFVIPKSGTLSRVDCVGRVDGTLASAGNCTVRYHLNSGAAVNLITTFPLTSANNAVSATGIGLSVVAGDFLNFSILTPTWATNPTLVSFALGAIIT